MNRHKRYPPEVRERAVRLVLEHQENYHSEWRCTDFHRRQDWLYRGNLGKPTNHEHTD